MATADPEPLWFLIAGTITAWDPKTRLLRVDGHELWVAPDISAAHVVKRANGTASGQEDHTAGRRVVTRLTVN